MSDAQAMETGGTVDTLGRRESGANPTIQVALTLAHGMAREVADNPGDGVNYSFIRPFAASRLLRSPIKGFMGRYRTDGEDLIEAIMSPIATQDPWILSCANFQEVMAFNLLNCPLPRRARLRHIRSLLMAPNCKGLVFWSHAGRNTLSSYGGVATSDPLWRKVHVVYPAVRTVTERRVSVPAQVRAFFFSGDFFRKGGVNVIDAFVALRREHPSVTLTLCCDPEKDFNTPDEQLRREYIAKATHTDGIIMRGRVPRSELLETVLPSMDVYLLPTYAETFGMAILEAMAFGKPLVATNHFAIPELVEDGVSGLLIDTSMFDTERMFPGYLVRTLPRAFREHVTTGLLQRMKALVEVPGLAERIGRAAVQVARTKFSFATRNAAMRTIYERALAS